mmetsp:Transcript_31810/g.50778  ORF Transcript_31810/g.50778 Transcript_31810/m.50778 type:complete len:359 (+) Transcript_31810:668-1744(+)
MDGKDPSGDFKRQDGKNRKVYYLLGLALLVGVGVAGGLHFMTCSTPVAKSSHQLSSQVENVQLVQQHALSIFDEDTVYDRQLAAKTPRPTKAPTEPRPNCRKARKRTQCVDINNCWWKRRRCRYTKKNDHRVLFIGNSFTIRNKLSIMFENLGRSAGKNTKAYQFAAGSMTWKRWNDTLLTRSMMHKFDDWKAIVLQEQSYYLSRSDFYVDRDSIPFAKSLYRKAIGATRRVMLYETWGYRNGDSSLFADTYEKMQDRIKRGYERTNQALNGLRTEESDPTSEIAYVGEAFRVAHPKFAEKLYTWDYKHPDVYGTYLAACVFYVQVYGKSPVGLRYKPRGISRFRAKELQRIAAQQLP